MLVRDLIDKNPAVCTEDLPLEQVYRLMEQKNSDHVVVIESNTHRIPIGVVTEHEMCMQILGRGRNPRGLLAANAMNTDFIKADLRSSLSDYCKDGKNNQPIIVVDENGSLQGIVAENVQETEHRSIPQRIFENVLPPSSVAVFDRIF